MCIWRRKQKGSDVKTDSASKPSKKPESKTTDTKRIDKTQSDGKSVLATGREAKKDQTKDEMEKGQKTEQVVGSQVIRKKTRKKRINLFFAPNIRGEKPPPVKLQDSVGRDRLPEKKDAHIKEPESDPNTSMEVRIKGAQGNTNDTWLNRKTENERPKTPNAFSPQLVTALTDQDTSIQNKGT